MEAKTTTRKYDNSELRRAGASSLFVRYYNIADKSASARREVEIGLGLDTLAQTPKLGGHFFEALWYGDSKTALARADSANTDILKNALSR
jgi:hypothetical protein